MYNLHNSGRHDGAVGLEFFFDIVVGPRLRAVAHKQVGRSVVSTSCIHKCAQIHVYIYKICAKSLRVYMYITRAKWLICVRTYFHVYTYDLCQKALVLQVSFAEELCSSGFFFHRP